tara:strand:+ start:2123 stop:2290 length:168 start_codon:yes stop_codon:yes gene_type:complete
MNKLDWKIAIAAIAGLTIIECVALVNGINGQLLFFMGVAIAGLGGVAIPNPFSKK